jgi:outer membrane biosynthesis protein TonB
VEEAPPIEVVEAEPEAPTTPEEAPAPAETVAEPEPAVESVAAVEPEAEPRPATEAVVEEAPSPAPAPADAVPTCPACGIEITPGDRFCSNCGAALKVAAAPVEVVPAAPPAPAPAVGPRLVVSASGAEIPLPVGEELLIGREDPVSGIFPDLDLTPHGGDEGGVSRQHARLFVQDDNYSIEDLDSTNFTFVNKQKLAPKTRQPVGDGDEIRLGRVTLILRTA